MDCLDGLFEIRYRGQRGEDAAELPADAWQPMLQTLLADRFKLTFQRPAIDSDSDSALVICTTRAYTLSMDLKELSFSEARENLTAILKGVEKTGQPVTILRRGKPAAVIISHEMFEQRIRKPKVKKWRLAGSIKVKRGVDVDEAIKKGREALTHTLRVRLSRDRSGSW